MIKIIIFILLLLAGYFINKKFKLIIVRKLIKFFLIYIGLPCLVLSSISDYKIVDFGLISLIILFSFILNITVSKLGNNILNLKNRGSFILLNSFSNAGFLGLPICWILFEDVGLFYGSLYVLVGTLLHYTLGIFVSIHSESKKVKNSIKKVLRFPIVWILGVVFLLVIFEVNIPILVISFFDFIGKVTLGVAIFYIGSNLVKPKNISSFFNECLYVAIFRFLVSPLLILIPLLFFGVEDYLILVLEAMMPPAIGSTIIAGYYGLNEKLCANITTVLTIVFLFIFFILFFI